MTHILIPISLIEDRIKLAEKEVEICKIYDFESAGQAARNRKTFYEMLLRDSKQISLDEKDIESHTFKINDKYLSDVAIEATKKEFPQEGSGKYFDFLRGMFKIGYKQALKDLL